MSLAPRTTPIVGQLLYSELQFYFLTDLPSRTCLSHHIGFSAGGPGQIKTWQKVTFALSNLTPYRFQKFEPHVFYSSLSAVSLESLVEIRSAVCEARAPHKDPREGTN